MKKICITLLLSLWALFTNAQTTMTPVKVVNEGYGGNNSSDASVLYDHNGSTYTIIADGESSHTFAYYDGEIYSGLYGEPDALLSETKVRYYIESGESFDLLNVNISNCQGTNMTFKITDDEGNFATSNSLADLAGENIATNFTSTTYFDVENPDGNLGCFWMYEITVDNLETITAVSTPTLENKVNLWPNPTKQGEMIYFSTILTNAQITSIDGQLISSHESINKVDTTNLESGIYYITSSQGSLKFIISN